MQQAHVAWDAIDHAENIWHDAIIAHSDRAAADFVAYAAAKDAYRMTTLAEYLLLVIGSLLLGVIPGLLYARNPSLLGGPLGGFLRYVASAMPRYPRRQTIAFYQGMGVALHGSAWAIIFLVAAATESFSAPVWLVLPAGLALILTWILCIPLIAKGAWWITSGMNAQSAQEQPQN